jgi:hypothetical protein
MMGMPAGQEIAVAKSTYLSFYTKLLRESSNVNDGTCASTSKRKRRGLGDL